MQRFRGYTVDLAKLKGDEDLTCPKCDTIISPDDESEDAYTILGTVMRGDHLDKITLRCNKCQSQIRLRGFQLLNKPDKSLGRQKDRAN